MWLGIHAVTDGSFGGREKYSIVIMNTPRTASAMKALVYLVETSKMSAAKSGPRAFPK
tara:strand:+ start:18225 stop:18398 length:174 start_codon:yes stop_codon:yes gene_type:complete